MRRLLLPALALGCAAALVVACFGPVLFRDRQLGFGDAGSFYYPLHLRIQQEWDAGRWPLWEPEENGGIPLLGYPSAAVLYPGKVIFALLPYPWAARVYPIAHVLMAGAAMYALMRHWATSRTGSALAALAYGFGGPMPFQTCNVIFLVGAAWIPVGLRGADRWLRLGRRAGVSELALALAMQVLGGDPQAAYGVGLCAGGYAVGLAAAGRPARMGSRWAWVLGVAGLVLAWIATTLAVAAWWPRTGEGGLNPQTWSWIRLGGWAGVGLLVMGRGPRGLTRGLAGLAGAAALAAALAGIQILPALEYLRASVRAAADSPHRVFPFSLEPLRLAELVWPGVFGPAFTNRFWLPLVPPLHEVDAWAPSLYLGGLSWVLAPGAAGLRRGMPWQRWLSAIAVAGLLLSLGRFGSPLWWARDVPGLASALGPHDPWDVGERRWDRHLPDGFGSPYGILAATLPGFRAFRYPSKFLPFVCLGLAGLAGLGWDRVVACRRRRPIAGATIALVLGPLALLGTIGLEGRLGAAWRSAPPPVHGSPFGRFDPQGAAGAARRALLHGSLGAALALLLVRGAGRAPRAAGAAALTLLTADLIAANAGLVPTVPQALLDSDNPPEALRRIEADRRASGATGPYRIYRVPGWQPAAWQADPPSADHAASLLAWERKTLSPKHAIPFGGCYTVTQGTTELYDLMFFFAPLPLPAGAEISRTLGLKPGAVLVYFPRRGFDLWTTEYFVLPHALANDPYRGVASLLPDTEVVYPPPSLFEGPDGPHRRARWRRDEDWQILRNRAAYPRAWIVHQVRHVRPITGRDVRARKAVMEAILYPADPFWSDPKRTAADPRALAWVEHPRSEVVPYPSGGPLDPSEAATVAEYTPQRVVLDVRLNQHGLVVLADVFYPGWVLTLDGRPAPILRVNRAMRGAAVAAGRHRLVFTYEPASVKLGAALTVLGLVVLIGAAFWARRQQEPAGID